MYFPEGEDWGVDAQPLGGVKLLGGPQLTTPVSPFIVTASAAIVINSFL